MLPLISHHPSPCMPLPLITASLPTVSCITRRNTTGPLSPTWEEFRASNRVIGGTAAIIFGLFKPTPGPVPHGATMCFAGNERALQ